jgi:hypothetical protein
VLFTGCLPAARAAAVQTEGAACRYNHHGAHRSFAGHLGWAEALIVVDVPTTVAPEHDGLHSLGGAQNAQHPARLPKPPRPSCRQKLLEMRMAASREDEGEVCEAPVDADLVLFEGKQRPLQHTASIMRHGGSLPRGACPSAVSSSQPQQQHVQRHAREGCQLNRHAGAALDARQHAVDSAGIGRGPTPVRAAGMTADIRQQPTSMKASRSRLAACDVSGTLALAHAEEASGCFDSVEGEGSGRGSSEGSRGMAEGGSGGARCQGVTEFLFSACATGVVHKWALDKQLQSDLYQVSWLFLLEASACCMPAFMEMPLPCLLVEEITHVGAGAVEVGHA